PGVRSDSDMYTLGYPFRPWDGNKALADGPSILRYIRETAREHGVEEKIRYRHRVLSAAWSSEEGRWTVEAERGEQGERVRLTCGFLMMCSGYYHYDAGYTPSLPDVESFRGDVVHPQQWSDDVDYAGKRVVVIGSGATAVTLVPAMAERAAHVTMLQRSPTYILSLPGEDPIARRLRRRVPASILYPLVRWKNVLLTIASYQLSRRRPRTAKALIRRGLERQLPPGYDIETHFKPTYDPWDQRLCLVPDGDLFNAIREGRASVVTDRIESFTEHGIRLESGARLDADIVVTATGLRLLALGGTELTVDGRPVRLSDTVSYRGTMLSGVPNLVAVIGYTNASWTLKSDLTSIFACSLINHMAAHGYRWCVADAPGPGVGREPFIGLASGYVLRSIQDFPAQGAVEPWKLRQNYVLDRLRLSRGTLEDGVLRFEGPVRAEASQHPATPRATALAA
ncbi:MAG: NAD(P)/FAD-dependent oxidoreductase, partial [Acidobacteriota bacterium]|nr:NAD(P)/FAD-dependent oxidoreductase [Acidobacteriota bacterium]